PRPQAGSLPGRTWAPAPGQRVRKTWPPSVVSAAMVRPVPESNRSPSGGEPDVLAVGPTGRCGRSIVRTGEPAVPNPRPPCRASAWTGGDHRGLEATPDPVHRAETGRGTRDRRRGALCAAAVSSASPLCRAAAGVHSVMRFLPITHLGSLVP